MITVIDRTLSVLHPKGSPEEISALIGILLDAGANVLELSEEMYRFMGDKLPAGKYMLRLAQGADAAQYPEIHRFVTAGAARANLVMSEEFHIRSPRDLQAGRIAPMLRPVRLYGFSDSMQMDGAELFSAICTVFLGHIEFCPSGQSGFSTALAAEWVLKGGSCVVTTLFGIEGFADFGEITHLLHVVRRRRPDFTSVLAEKARTLLCSATDAADLPSPGTPVLRLGLHSGCQVVRFKLEQLGIPVGTERLKTMTSAIHRLSRQERRYLTDAEVLAIAESL